MKRRPWAIVPAILLAFGQTWAASSAAPIPVAGSPGLGGEEVSGYLDKNLSGALKAEIRRRGLAVWTFTAASEKPGGNLCLGAVGLTYAAPKDRNVRVPALRYYNTAELSKDNWDEKACREKTLLGAIRGLSADKVEAALRNIDATKGGGGTRQRELADDEVLVMYPYGLPDSQRSRVSDAIRAHSFTQAFDFRQVAISVLAFAPSSEGDRYCFAVVGVTATSTDDRWGRWPGHWVAAGQWAMPEKEGDETCMGDAAIRAVNDLLNDSWGAEGLLKDFVRARENGVQMPNAVAAETRHQQALAYRRVWSTEP